MGSWFSAHAPHPIQKAEEMFEFTLANGRNYSDVLEEVGAAVQGLLAEVRDENGQLRQQEQDAKLAARNALRSAVQDAIDASEGVWDPFGSDSATKALYV